MINAVEGFSNKALATNTPEIDLLDNMILSYTDQDAQMEQGSRFISEPETRNQTHNTNFQEISHITYTLGQILDYVSGRKQDLVLYEQLDAHSQMLLQTVLSRTNSHRLVSGGVAHILK